MPVGEELGEKASAGPPGESGARREAGRGYPEGRRGVSMDSSIRVSYLESED